MAPIPPRGPCRSGSGVAVRASAWMPVAPLVLVARGRRTKSVRVASRADGLPGVGGPGLPWTACFGIGVWTDAELRRLRRGIARRSLTRIPTARSVVGVGGVSTNPGAYPHSPNLDAFAPSFGVSLDFARGVCVSSGRP
jgi:hypothetical protein